MVTLVRIETGTQTAGHRDTEIMSRGDTEITSREGTEITEIVNTGVVTVTTPGGEMVTVDRGGVEIRDILPLTAGQEAGVVTGSGMSMKTTQAMGTMGGRRTSVGTDISERDKIL